ncbi:ribosome maturation factor RimM [Kineosporiaceae bacterium SCSIO 59966]|nr:ribosome maturation factor RimM [Kineosporiaceae bacterium SCSIO 59966]
MDVVVARVGRPHGVRGEVTVEVRTDVPELRLRPGAVLSTDPDRGRFTVGSARDHNGRLLLTFAEVTDRTTAEGLRGVLLVADVDPEAEEPEHDAWPAARLVGLRAVTVDGREVGRVAGVLHLPAQDLLEVDQPSGATVLVPFVRAIVPQVDVDGGRVVLDPPGGLLED